VKHRIPLFRVALLLCCFVVLPVAALESSNTIPATGTIEYAFTPGGEAADLIVRTIDLAHSQILVQAYSFTHRGIAHALVRAHRRGIDVQVIADREQVEGFESAAMRDLIAGGVPVFTDAEHAAAHNKVMIIDRDSKQSAIITGSFNFTFAAQNRNAENVLVLHGNQTLANAFFANWQQHREHAVAMPRGTSK
jgi:phosphatidylserine/phosphatidylglycerophosphate/cardiolipin synthase-like enzyme